MDIDDIEQAALPHAAALFNALAGVRNNMIKAGKTVSEANSIVLNIAGFALSRTIVSVVADMNGEPQDNGDLMQFRLEEFMGRMREAMHEFVMKHARDGALLTIEKPREP